MMHGEDEEDGHPDKLRREAARRLLRGFAREQEGARFTPILSLTISAAGDGEKKGDSEPPGGSVDPTDDEARKLRESGRY